VIGGQATPTYAPELGRFTPLRAGGLPHQTFKIKVAAGTESGVPISRGRSHGSCHPTVT